MSTTAPRNQPVTAACCIIGDEILNGKTRDSNAHFLAKYLFDCGIDLKRVEIIGDDYDHIAQTVTRLSSQHDLVFTSGGIGPTHDDISYEAIARAYSLPLKVDEETCTAMQKVMGVKFKDWKLTDARKRMATFPAPAKILRTSPHELWVPVVVVNDNIHILPGIPRLFERLMADLKPRFEHMASERGAGGRYYRVQVATKMSEGDIANFLTETQNRVTDQHVKIGSYPKWGSSKDGARVVVSIVGRDQEAIKIIGNEVLDGIKGWLFEPVKKVDHVDT
ncbi:MoaB/Mog domain-containing protein [Zychaea mexicana]|uniref:MoaB/Mog domain-containing protein n=1 Tax=Zychaea mexicana TaxID=64656 RepID=UPI0022FED831|nr:MoaB/Mog domain-containing protein [Zychaea mexicana]KAI9490084.1 MoaB/Mog domain-containing protein [Zychaea mexicana]